MKKNFIRKILIILLFAIFIFCVVNVYDIYSSYNKANNEYQELLDSYTQEISADIKTEEQNRVNQDKSNQQQEYNDVELSQENNYTYIFSKMVDFDSLLSLNSDIIGWITIPGTIIDYPIVKSSDNNDYLHLTFLKEYNSSGSIFLDMRNNENLTDYNSIIYGHNMKNGSMFSSLRNYQNESFYKDHVFVEIYLPNSQSVYKIISCYATTKTSNGYNVDFNDKTEYENWLKEISDRSQYSVEDYDIEKPTITLSTCNGQSGSEKRWVIHIQQLY